MHYYEVAPTQIVRVGNDSFTYSSNELLAIGSVVIIEVGKKQMIGIVLRESTKPTYTTKPITSSLSQIPLPRPLIDLAIWMSAYYVTPLATVLQTILPRGLQKTRRSINHQMPITKRDRTNIVFNDEQSSVIDYLSNANPGTYLLQGITGSGKTEIYIDVAKKTIGNGKSVIILAPEIALTPQLISEFSNHFSDLLLTHSKMSESARHNVWNEALSSATPRVVIGPRSAIFTPFKTIGAIIIDEAHEPSFKQEQSPKYSALRVATMLGRFHNAKVIFGSATPSVVDRYLAEQSSNQVLRLTKIARQNSQPPIVSLVDMTKRANFSKHRFISNQLIEQITSTLSSGKQALIFHNRRGSTSTTLCEECGWTTECPRCFLPLTLHADQHCMRCRICNHKTNIPTHCPNCGSVNIIHKGIGTKLIEAELHKLFPDANIARFDADNSDDATVSSRYEDLYRGTIDIAIGTQVVAKGLDLPNLRTVGIIQADSGLSLPDYSTNERTFQLLSQVIGRVGRNEHKTQVIVQTYQPTHPSIINGIKQDYESFYAHTIRERQHGLFPPFTHLLKLTCVYKTESTAIKNSQLLAKELRLKLPSEVQILGPTPAFYERQNNTYRWQLIIKSPKREYLINAVALIPPKSWQFELDPTSLL